MNFRTSHLVGIFAVILTVLTVGPSINLAVAESLKITGPEGQVKSVKRQYGPTTSSDTFWSIAQAVKPDNSVTVYQVMSALFDANPHAFSGNNYNSLERGMILLVPSKDVMQQVSTANAKKRAENNDRGWSPTASTKAKPAESIVKPQVNPTVKLVSKASETPAEIKLLTNQLEQADALNLALTDELARATDEITISSTDTESFQQKISELQAENALLKQALQDKNIENETLKADGTAKQEKIDLLSQEKEQPTSTLWRSLMDDPLLLILGASIPALLMLGLFWMFLRRRNESGTPLEVNPETSEVDALTQSATSDEASDTDDSLAIHLDTEQAESSVDLLDEIEQPKSNDSAEFVVEETAVEETADEGQSLDALWAEAMGEQDGEGEAFDSLEQPSAENEDDLDTLLAGFDEESNTDTVTKEDDLDALLAGFDEEPKSESIADEDDLDSLLAGFDEEPKSESIADEDDLDALLAGFDEDTSHEALNSESEPDELDLLLAANSPAIKENVSPKDDLDSLLAEFDMTADEQDTLTNDSDVDALSDEMVAELELPLEIAAELDLGVDDISMDEADLDNELDALLADLDAPVDEHALQIPQESKALIDNIAAELATEMPEQSVEAGELDSLLAEFNLSETSADNVPSELDSNEENNSALTEAANVDFSLDFDTSALDATALTEFKNNVETDVDSSIDLKIDADEQPEAADNMLEFTSTPIEPSVKVEKDSGFFDDLKGTKKAEPAALDWDAASAELTNSTLTDDELLSALAATGASAVEGEDEEDINSFIIEDDSKLTVDQALAALDADEGNVSASHIPEHDLTSFQKDNGFIDIDRLLNEADEDNVETDLYKELDVDMGELDTFMGNIAMVDVDDAENSINAKLDLARAYIEIDDNDSAHALLKEVELDGNERQQEEAAGLIKELL